MLMQFATAIIARWQLSLGILGLLVISHTLTYCTGRGDGREAVKLELRAAEVKAGEKAMKAVAKQEAAAAVRAEAEAVQAKEALQAVERAEAEGGNSLDALF